MTDVRHPWFRRISWRTRSWRCGDGRGNWQATGGRERQRASVGDGRCVWQRVGEIFAMGEITVSGRIARQDPLDASPEASYCYLADNESLLKRFLGPDRVTVLSAGQYRIQMKRFRILGFSFKPGFDVAFAQTPPDRITMQSISCQLSERSHPDLNVDATFWGAAHFAPDGNQCILKSEVEAQVRLSLPGALAWLPGGLVQPVANGLLQATLEALSLRLIPMMRADLARTLKKQPSPLSVKEETVS